MEVGGGSEALHDGTMRQRDRLRKRERESPTIEKMRKKNECLFFFFNNSFFN